MTTPMRERAATVAKTMCKLCADGVLYCEGHMSYDGWHQLTEDGGAADGGTDYEECAAFELLAFARSIADDPNPTRSALEECVRAMEAFAERFQELKENPPTLGQYLFVEKRTITFDGRGEFNMADVRKFTKALATARNALQETEK